MDPTDRLDGCGPPVVRASIDGFHQPREVRHRRGELSAEGYYRDAFDYAAIVDQCLVPFRDRARSIRTRAYDFRADARRDEHVVDVPTKAVLIFDGVFLLREELDDLWTYSVYLDLPPEESLRRAIVRDLELFGSREEVERRYLGRYLPGQALSREESNPRAVADLVVDGS